MSWAEAAFTAVEQIAHSRRIRGGFTCEELRGEFMATELDEPIDQRHWGAVIRRALRENIIEPTNEFRLARSSNHSPKRVYRFVPRGWK